MNRIIVYTIIILFFTACTQVITPNLNNVPPQLNIQGIVSDTIGPYHVSITSSVNFYANNTWPGVSGAVVTITDATAGIVDSLTETSPGYYTTHTITGTSGNTYLLKVMWAGNIYTASSVMPQPVVLDSVSFDVSDPAKIRAQANWQDPAGVTNYYKYSLLINGVHDTRFQTFSDRLSDGRYIRDKLDNDTSEIKKEDLVQLSLVGVDKNAYTYLNEAEDIAYSNDNLNAPATPASNISGGCLGYFSAQTVSSKKAVVKF